VNHASTLFLCALRWPFGPCFASAPCTMHHAAIYGQEIHFFCSDFHCRMSAPCTLHHAPCTMQLCVWCREEILAYDLYHTCLFLLTWILILLSIMICLTKMYHAPCTMQVCVRCIVRNFTLWPILTVHVYYSAPWSYFFLKIDFFCFFFLWFSIDFSSTWQDALYVRMYVCICLWWIASS